MIAGVLLAATFSVANRQCPQHGNVHGEACSHATATCGADATPCCTFEEAIRRANGAAGTDNIDLHDMTGSKETAGATRADGSAWTNVVYHTTTGYADSLGVINVSVVAGDTYKLDFNGSTSGIQFGILVRGDNSTFNGFTMDNKMDSGDGTTYSGRSPYLYILAQGVTVDGMTFTQPNLGPTLSNNVSIRFGADDETTVDSGIVRNSILSGHYHTFIFMSDIMGTCSASGFAIYNNKFIPIRTDRTSSSSTILISERGGCGGTHTGGALVFANNQVDGSQICTSAPGCSSTLPSPTCCADPRGIYYRESDNPYRIFNNRWGNMALDRGIVYFQDTSSGTSEDFRFFFNTILGTGHGIGGTQTSQSWPACAGSASGPLGIHFRSNLWSGISPGADLGSGCSDPSNTSNQRSTNDDFNDNFLYRSTTPVAVNLISGPDITHTGNTATTTNPNITNGGTVTATSLPDTLRLVAGSNAIGACSNNPLGTGNGNCSVTAAGITFNCNLDIDGHSRGTGATADCGADQFVAVPPDPGGTGTQKRRIVRLGP